MPAKLITVQLRHAERRVRRFTAQAKHENNDRYQEISVCIMDGGNLVADLLVLIDEDDGKPVIYCSTGGNADEHTLAIHPLRDRDAAVQHI